MLRCVLSLRGVACLTVLLSSSLWAKPATRAPVAKPKPAEVKPAETPAPAPSTPTETKLDANATPAQLVSQLNQLYESLEYERVIPFAEACLKRSDLQMSQQLEVYRLLGSAKAIVEDPVDAEKPFRLLLRARPDYDLPGNTPPKILAVFRKVQSEEKALAGQLREVERERLVASLKLLDGLPGEAKGGRALPFSLRLRDPGSAVETVRVAYRRAGDKAFSSLALTRSEQGDWRGVIPADFTASSGGFGLEYFIETADGAGPLLSVGTQLAPKSLPVTAGLVETRAFKPVHPTVTWVSFSLAVAAGLAAGAFAVAFNVEQGQYKQLASGSSVVEGATLAEHARTGATLATGVNASLIGFGVTAITTAILFPLTDFESGK